MHERRCVVVGAGRIAGGFLTPMLRDRGWQVTLICRSAEIRRAINGPGGVFVHVAGEPDDRWLDGVTAVALDEPGLDCAVAEADLLATAVGASALAAAGRLLAPLIVARLAATGSPVNLVLFENHRRAQELLTSALLTDQPSLAREVGRRLGISAAVVWPTVSRRDVTAAGVRFTAGHVDRCCIDALGLVHPAAPANETLPGVDLVRSFDDRMVEKLWLFNAGHATAAYLGWHAGCTTMTEALADPDVRSVTVTAMTEARQAFDVHVARRPGSVPFPDRPLEAMLRDYADPTLEDPVVRVAQEPRRKLAADDRLTGPALACLAAGIQPVGLAEAAAAALAYREPTDQQAVDLAREIAVVGPTEVLATLTTLDPHDDFVRLSIERYPRFDPATTGRA